MSGLDAGRADEARRYFSQPGFERFLARLKAKYESSTAGPRGYVTLERVSEEERLALDGFYGTYSAPVPEATRRYAIREFERILARSRFGLSIPELLAVLSGASVLTRQERQASTDAAWARMIAEAAAGAGVSAAEPDAADSNVDSLAVWVQGLRDETAPGARTLRRVFVKSAYEAGICLRSCLNALRLLESGDVRKPIRLPILAARLTGDAHALDWKHPLGRLFWSGLAALYGGDVDAQLAADEDVEDVVPEAPEPSIDSQAILIREGYRKGGIADDDLSSQVMLYAPPLLGIGEERVLTLRQVERLANDQHAVTREEEAIFMVENPSVFAELVDADNRVRDEDSNQAPIIVCGNGVPSSAVLKLLDLLAGRSGRATLWYAGDLDPAGLAIAQGLYTRYSGTFRAWRMDTACYRRYADCGIAMTEGERARLRQSTVPWDEELAHVMAGRGVKLHQELWVEELVADFLKKRQARWS